MLGAQGKFVSYFKLTVVVFVAVEVGNSCRWSVFRNATVIFILYLNFFIFFNQIIYREWYLFSYQLVILMIYELLFLHVSLRWQTKVRIICSSIFIFCMTRFFFFLENHFDRICNPIGMNVGGTENCFLFLFLFFT